MTYRKDLESCRDLIKTGSYSFYAASRLLPARVRDPAIVLYSFCRLADDSIDNSTSKQKAYRKLSRRLDLVYKGKPIDTPFDRAFSGMVDKFELPKALPKALLEGMKWDAEGRQYRNISDLKSYSARVASAVGVMMCVIMGARNKHVLARACDLGVAMQLTNIARDIGEDAKEGRLYIPLDWFSEMQITQSEFFEGAYASFPLASITERLLKEADFLYKRATHGLAGLPIFCRPGIFSALHIYSRIGKHIAKANYDSVNKRAVTSKSEKLSLLMYSLAESASVTIFPNHPSIKAPALDEVKFLVEAASLNNQKIPIDKPLKSDIIFDVLAGLKKRDLEDLEISKTST